MPREATVNSSPLIGLYNIGALDIMGVLYSNVKVTKTVVSEILAGPNGRQLAEYLENQDWVEIVEAPAISDEIKSWDLGEGETSVIALAKALPEIEVVIDDRAATRCADLLGLKTIGVLGILIRAKHTGELKEIKSRIDALIVAGFWVSQKVREEALKLAGESI